MKKIISLLVTAAIAASSFCAVASAAKDDAVKIKVQAEDFDNFYCAVLEKDLTIKDLVSEASEELGISDGQKSKSGTGGAKTEKTTRSVRPFKNDKLTYTFDVETAGRYSLTLFAGVQTLAGDWCDVRISPWFEVNGVNAFDRPGVVLPAHKTQIWGFMPTVMGDVNLVAGENTVVIGLDGAQQWGNQPVLIDWFELELKEAAPETTAAPEATEAPTVAPEATEAPTAAPESAEAPVYIIKSGDGVDEMSTYAANEITTEKMIASNGAAAPFMQKDGSNYVPFRYLFEKFGMVDVTEKLAGADIATADKALFAAEGDAVGTYAWQLVNDVINIRIVVGAFEITLVDGQPIAGLVNDDGSALQLPVIVKDGVTYLPIRAVQLLGYQISYDGETELIYITKTADNALGLIEEAAALLRRQNGGF